jgi:hypothetical protein
LRETLLVNEEMKAFLNAFDEKESLLISLVLGFLIGSGRGSWMEGLIEMLTLATALMEG